VAEGKKSVDQLIQLAMSVYYNWDVTGKKRIKDTMTSLQLSGSAPPDWANIPSLLPLWTGGALPQRML
jgi:hypothetical protein